jgi:hypothetical protein
MSSTGPSSKNRRRIRKVVKDEADKNGYFAAVELLQEQAERLEYQVEQFDKIGAFDEDGKLESQTKADE